MKDRTLYILWAVLFAVCALLGFVEEPQGLLKALMVLLSVGFFVPGALLLYRGVQQKNEARLGLLRNLSAIWLGLTLVLLVANFASVAAAELTGDLLYGLLVMLSAPMVCGQYWVVSLFLWACLLMSSLSFLKKIRH